MKSIIIIAIPAVIILAALMGWTHYTLAYGGSHTMDSKASVREEKTIPVSSAPTIILESDAGNVQLAGGSEGSVRIDAVKRAPTEAEAQKMTFQVEDINNTIHIVYRRGDRDDGDRNIDFTIHAPADSMLHVSTGGGNIGASGFSQGITGHTGGGNLHLENVTGSVRLDTGGGNIEGEDLKGAINLTTGGGNIDASGGLSGEIQLRTGGGNIAARIVDGAVTAQTGAGNIAVDGRFTGTSDISTGAGNIDAVIPADSSLSIHAATTNGMIHDDFGLPANTASMGGMIALDGRLGSGADKLNITTGTGNISIGKS